MSLGAEEKAVSTNADLDRVNEYEAADPGLQNRILRKMDMHTLPLLGLAYFLSYLDRSNIGNAKKTTIQADLGISNSQWSWAISVFYFGYVIFEVPANILLRRWRPSKLIAIMMMLWGASSAAMAGANGPTSLYILRVLNGAFEAGLFPGVVYYLSLFYLRREQGRRVGAFWSIAAISGAVGGLIAALLTAVDNSSLKEWQLLFVVEGVPNLFVAVAIWFLLPDSPEQAKFLDEKERDYVITRLRADAGASHDHSFSWPQVTSVLTDFKTYVYACIYITGTVSLQGVTYFLPSIISGLNSSFSTFAVQGLTTPAYIIAFLLTITLAYTSDKLKDRAYHMIAINLFGMVGFLILMYGTGFGLTYVGAIIVTASVYANVSIKVAWFSNNYGGLTRRAAASGVIVSIGTIGGAIGGQIYYDPPTYFHGHTIAICCVAAQTVLVIGLRAWFVRENNRRENMTEEEKDALVRGYGSKELAGDRMPEFRYTY
ncbi:hypothetical protein HK100_002367 [Physocladia obscura]|uniref:Major facilitator superfamily (MFS) profile domain-containing protein n=1 Tax=Physocladia obscura TaxID=109957 RepID=A0AAD5SVV5_9FUNG|nr:hypothetical protein HK100_002367 [Physocladia obscura]